MSLTGDMLCVCNSLLAAIEKSFYVTGLPVEFSRGEPLLQSNELFNSDSVLRMLEAKDYQ